jgi:hypothetical protein
MAYWMQATAPCEMPSSVTGPAGRAASITASRSSVHCGTVSWRSFHSLMPQPRSSWRTKRKCAEKNCIQCRQTGLCHSYSRCVSQFAALTSTGPVPASAQARRVPSVAVT